MNIGVYIIGAGGHCKQVIDAFESQKILINGLFDDSKTGKFYGYQILGKIDSISDIIDSNCLLFNSIGDNKVRRIISEKLSEYKYINCIHERSYISKSVVMGYGNYVGPNCSLNSDSNIGNFNIFNYNSSIGHDVTISNFNHFAPSSCLAGNIKIGDNNSFFVNSSIIPKIIVKNNIILGAGSTLIRSPEIEGTYVGSPARILN